jgi:crossover junction endodeoxyribonuclease RusA
MSTMTTQTLTIRIDLTPDASLNPNRSNGRHWAARTKAKADLEWATIQGIGPYRWDVPEPPLTVRFTVAWEKGRKTMDGDNLLASLKPCIDVIAWQLDINDKHFRFAPIEQTRDPDGRGYMTVTLSGVGSGGEEGG